MFKIFNTIKISACDSLYYYPFGYLEEEPLAWADQGGSALQEHATWNAINWREAGKQVRWLKCVLQRLSKMKQARKSRKMSVKLT